MKILVTGGAGFIGSHVVDRLLGDGHAVAIVDNLSTGRRQLVNGAAELIVCDLRSDQLQDTVDTVKPDAVVHVAAQAAVSRSVADPAFDASVNVVGTIKLLEGCRRLGIGRIVYTSTGGAAYGDTDVVPTPEDHPARPSSPYGVSKVTAERYLECFQGLTGIKPLALRLANIYGPRQNPLGEAGVIAIFCHRLLRGEPCIVNGDGEQTRDYVFVEDVAAAVSRAIARPDITGMVNIGTGVETTVNELYRRLARAAGVTTPAPHAPARPGEQRRSVLAAARAKELLGWTPSVPLADGLERTFAYFKKEVGA
ncbi:MAG: NAD-dependent epimerase/dehydratase family protein [Candidatus Rokubacteria bacterium]|nr:NAD-dependent epimerase/dehydratase family protein [Candidatus Rokubacteria bacterium]